MTSWQELAQRLRARGREGADTAQPQDPDERWEQAPAPAKVAKLIGEKLLHRRVSAARIPLLTTLMHWSTGIGWGGVYGVLGDRMTQTSTLRSGALFGSVVWVMSYVQLVPLGIYKPPWRYPLGEEALDLSYHLVYGTGVSLGYRVLKGTR